MPKNSKAEKRKIDYDWIEPLLWHVGETLKFEYKPVEEFRKDFNSLPKNDSMKGRYAFLIKKGEVVSETKFKPENKYIHSLACLGFMIYFGRKEGLNAYEFQNDLFPKWVKENGLPVCTSQFPYHRLVTTCDASIRSAPMTLKLLIDYWPVEHQFELDNPEYFLMLDTTLRAFAVDAFILYAEVCLIFDEKFKQERKKRLATFKSTISEDDACEALFDVGKVLFSREILDEDIELSKENKLPPQMMIMYRNKFTDLWVRMAKKYEEKRVEGDKSSMSHRDKDVGDYLGHVFEEIENYMYRVHLGLKSEMELTNGNTIKLRMAVRVPDLLSLGWLELFLMAKSEGSYGLRLCKAVNCPNGFFVPKRENQIFCCDLCRSGQNIKEAREEKKQKAKTSQT